MAEKNDNTSSSRAQQTNEAPLGPPMEPKAEPKSAQPSSGGAGAKAANRFWQLLQNVGFFFLLKRIGYGFLVMLGVMTAVFFMSRVLPGDPVEIMAGRHATEAIKADIRKDFGLDKSLPMQFYLFARDLSVLSVHDLSEKERLKYNFVPLVSLGERRALVLKPPFLGRSYKTNRKVGERLLEVLPSTIVLALSSMILATFFGIVFGMLAALRQGKLLDQFLLSSTVVGISAPSFVSAMLISFTFGYYLTWTGLPMSGPLWEYGMDENSNYGYQLKLINLILPTVTLGIRPLAIITQLTRSSMLEVVSQDYIRTARAKGLREQVVIVKHALKNALNPVVTAVSGWLASLMAGTIFVEQIFSWNGLGSVTIDAVMNRDFPMVMGSALLVAFIFVIVNIVVDLLYALLDPRVRLS